MTIDEYIEFEFNLSSGNYSRSRLNFQEKYAEIDLTGKANASDTAKLLLKNGFYQPNKARLIFGIHLA